MAQKLKCKLLNRSNKVLTLRNKHLDAGVFDPQDQPKDRLEPDQSTSWTVTSEGDIEGWVLYKVGGGADWSMFDCYFRDRIGRDGKGDEFYSTVHRLPNRRTESPYRPTEMPQEADREVTYEFREPDQNPPRPSVAPKSAMDAVATCGKRSHASLTGSGRKAMICPEGDVAALRKKIPQAIDSEKVRLEVAEQNRVFAQQWVDFDKSRKLFFLKPDDTFDDFVERAGEAADWVGSGEVLLFVGHGGADGFRGVVETCFDTVPEIAQGLSHHKHLITTTLLITFPKLMEQKDGKWVRRPTPGINVNDPKIGKEDVAVLAKKWEGLERLGKRLERNGVALFTVVSCNVGLADHEFGPSLAQRLKTPVRLFKKLVAVAELRVPDGPNYQYVEEIWLTTDPITEEGRPKNTQLGAESLHEVPNHTQALYDADGALCG